MLDQLFHFPGWSFKVGPFSFTFSITGIIEIIIFAIAIYYIIVWIKRTKAWNLLKGVTVLLIVYLAAYFLGFSNLTYLFNVLFGSLLIAVIIIFQPEIRRALETLGNNNPLYKLIPALRNQDQTTELTAESIEDITHAMSSLAKNKVGALVVIERTITLDEYVKTGITLDAQISSSLLEQIFEKNTPLHDGAVIIKKNRIVAATCYLPLSQDTSLSKELGTRHRAGLGMAEATDAVVIIVSEETGALSVAIGHTLKRNITDADLREILFSARLENENEEKTKTKTRKGSLRERRKK